MVFDPGPVIILWFLIPLVLIAAILVLIRSNSRQQPSKAQATQTVNTTRKRIGAILLFALLFLLAAPFLMIVVGGDITLTVLAILFILLLASLGIFKRRA